MISPIAISFFQTTCGSCPEPFLWAKMQGLASAGLACPKVGPIRRRHTGPRLQTPKG